MHKSEVVKFLILRTTGNFLLLFALAGITLTFGQALYQESLYRINLLRGLQYALADNPMTGSGPAKPDGPFGQLLLPETTVSLTPVSTDFAIVIPKIGANAQIVKNVDPAIYNDYMAALKTGVAHAAGSVFPGMDGNVYLFAHSTDYFWNVGRYNAVFYLLKEVAVGDEVDVFYNGRRFIYTVSETKIINPDEISYLTNNIGGEPRLTLQTCWPPGTTIKRLLVFAKPKSTN